MFFPSEGKALTGRRVSLVVVPRLAATDAHFFVGSATCDGRSISVTDFHARATPFFEAPAEALRTFDPELLPQLIVPEHLPNVRRLISNIDGCVVVFADSAPSDGVVIREAFYGLGVGAAGQPLLFQGGLDVDRADPSGDDEDPEPWESTWPDGAD